MSITPIERGSSRGDESSEPETKGVVARLRTAAKRVAQRVRSWLDRGRSGGESTTEKRERGQIRVSGQRQLESPEEQKRTAGRPPIPAERSGVMTRRQGEQLRVYDPTTREAYVASDTWERVRR